MEFSSTTRFLAVLALASLPLAVPGRSQSDPAQAPAADNTKMNKRDRSTKEPTSDQAKENTSDRALMQKIRKAIVSDKSLSSYAHNVKVIAENGKVTLKGPVHSDEEKEAVAAKATEIAGAGNVTNQLTVKAGKATSNKKPKSS